MEATGASGRRQLHRGVRVDLQDCARSMLEVMPSLGYRVAPDRTIQIEISQSNGARARRVGVIDRIRLQPAARC